jgi:hypothetical protein
MLRAGPAAIAMVALTLVACGGSDSQTDEHPATTPMPTAEGNFFVADGAVEGTLVPDGPATCTTTTAILSGTVAAEDYGLIVTAPFASVTAGGVVGLPPPPELDASVKLTGSRSREWVADASRASGIIRVGMDLVSGSFDAQLVASDGSAVHAVGTWSCEPRVPATSR